MLEASTALEVPEVMRCALLCIVEAADGGLYEAFEVLDVLEVMRCVLLRIL